jgi:uncharacterized protein (DUF1800 family)
MLHRLSLILSLGVGALMPMRAAESAPALPADQQQIVHVLNRITFGPRPGDVEAVRQMGLSAYIEQQLHPESIPDQEVEQEVGQLALLQMSPEALFTFYLDERKRTKQEQQRKLQADRAAQAAAGNTNANVSAGATMSPAVAEPMPALDRRNEWKTPAVIGQLEDAKILRAIHSNRQLQEVLVDFWSNHFNIDMKKGPCRVLKVEDDRDVIRPHVLGRFRDLLEASAKSPAMLFYLDNAENSKAPPPQLAEQMPEDTFKDVADPVTPAAPLKKRQGGINENYAREIMELHTLGVNGGYTQKDVQEVARCFTGWTIDRNTGDFVFRPKRHDNGSKLVLGHEIPAGGGMRDGETVLDILASQPATAHFICQELCQRFVSDDPPEALVTRIAGVFQSTNGDLRQVTRAILTSPEFLSPSSFQSKIKTPLEFTVSAVRATESSVVVQPPPPFDKLRPAVEGAAVLGRTKASDRLSQAKRQSLNWHIVELGEPLFVCTPPTGYKEDSRIWVSPGALIERLNFALALTQQQVADVRFDPQNILSHVDLDKPEAVLEQCVSALLQGNISAGTRAVLARAALPPKGDAAQTVDPSKLIALVLGSPEFQRK